MEVIKIKKISIFAILVIAMVAIGGFALVQANSSDIQETIKQVENTRPSCGLGNCNGATCDGSCLGECGVKSCGCGR